MLRAAHNILLFLLGVEEDCWLSARSLLPPSEQPIPKPKPSGEGAPTGRAAERKGTYPRPFDELEGEVDEPLARG
jgi:hypothetical protein